MGLIAGLIEGNQWLISPESGLGGVQNSGLRWEEAPGLWDRNAKSEWRMEETCFPQSILSVVK